MRDAVRGPLVAFVLLAALALSPACGNNDQGGDTPTDPSTFIVTETFSGVLTRNGAASYSFNVQAAGTVTVTLSAISDPSGGVAPNIGISLGTWDGTACSVQTGIFTDNASLNASISGLVQGAGVLCARVYDPQSWVTNPLNYTLTVTHP
jgi:hypothetical protein